MNPYKLAHLKVKHRMISDALDRHNGCKAKAARELQISPRTIYNVLNKYKELYQ